MIARLRAIMTAVTSREGVFLAGLALVAYGAFLVYPPLGFVAPGAVLVWFTIPGRPPFFFPKTPIARQDRT